MRALLFKLLLPFVAIVSLKFPFYGLLIYILFNIIRPEMLFWGGHTGNIVFKVAIFSTLAGYLWQKSTSITSPSKCREFWLLLWIAGATAISVLLADLPPAPRAWYYTFEIFKIWIICWLILGIVSKSEQMLRIQYGIIVAVTLLSAWGIEQHFRGNVRLEGLGGDAFSDSNGVAAVVVLFFPIAMNMLVTAKKIKLGLIWLVMAGAMGMVIIYTQSRGGFIGVVIGVSVLLLTTRKKKLLVSLMAAIIIAASPFIGDEYKQRMSTISSGDGERDLSSGSRLVLWQAGALIFMDNKLFGVGLLNFSRAKLPYKSSLTGKVDSELLDYSFRGYKVGHSTYLGQILPEGGLFLATPCLLLFILFLRQYIKTQRLKIGATNTKQHLGNLLTGMTAGIVAHCFALSFVDGFIGLFLPMQLTFAGQLIRIMKLESEEKIVGGVLEK